MRISDWSSDVCSSDLICGDLVRVTPDRGRSTATIIDVAQGSWSIPRPHDNCARRRKIGDHLGIWITTFQIRKDRFRSEERREGKECVRTWRCREAEYNSKNNKNIKYTTQITNK